MTLNRSICALEHIWWPSLFPNVPVNPQFLQHKINAPIFVNFRILKSLPQQPSPHRLFDGIFWIVCFRIDWACVHIWVVFFKYYKWLSRSSLIDILFFKLFQLLSRFEIRIHGRGDCVDKYLDFHIERAFLSNPSLQKKWSIAIKSSLVPCNAHNQ